MIVKSSFRAAFTNGSNGSGPRVLLMLLTFRGPKPNFEKPMKCLKKSVNNTMNSVFDNT